MTTAAPARAAEVERDAAVRAPAPALGGRRCACGGIPGPGGECAACRARRLRRHAVVPAPAAVPPVVGEALRSPGRPLDTPTRAFMERRFGHDFSQVRVHVDGAAAASAHAVDADAYTVGEQIAFGRGRFAPQTAAGRELLAHELVHVVQQRGFAGPGGDAEAEAEAASRRVAAGGQADVRSAGPVRLQRKPAAHITHVRVNQTTPEKVTATWSDGHTDSDECSTGKGHCCFDDTTGMAEGGACSAARSVQIGNNCTPIGTFAVTGQLPKTPAGIEFWTQFHDAKQVALHDYDPFVDGTPLSHGCVRLHRDFAKLIFDGARIGVTRVTVEGLARPRCNHGELVGEWADDFKQAGTKPPDGETINPDTGKRFTRAEIQHARHAIKETRDELRSALGVDEAGLDARLAAVGTEPKDVRAAIPRCLPALTVQEQGVPKAEESGVAGDAAKTAAALERALGRTRTQRAAETAVKAAAAALEVGFDDDEVRWTRLALSRVIRQFNPTWARSADDLRRLQADLLDLLGGTAARSAP